MKSNSIRPVGRAGTASNLPDSKSKQAGPKSGVNALQQKQDAALFDSSQEKAGFSCLFSQKSPEDYLAALEESNEGILAKALQNTAKSAQLCAVPSLIGATLHGAVGKLKPAGLKIGVIRHMPSGQLPRSYVISQAPRPGALVERGARISLVISTGEGGQE